MNNSGTKTGLFLMELVVALLLFAFCAAICMQLFVAARSRTRDSDNLSQAVYLATSAAECYKSSGGSLEAVQKLLGSEIDGDNGINGNTLVFLMGVGDRDDYLRVVVTDSGGTAEIAVFDGRPNKTEKLIYSLTVKAVDYVA